ncbi:hypothetical protein N7U66_18980 [Lacinutrix neustonica]|uniref:Transglutaminase-like domain-containing protein n=1 Tax=Lacinutrix neustonica TaxID=2980107 RepID=A0A9E8SD01_9FLAO|nr:transglutaminase domain-containing protein [Lacinutrix neustonica]WAC01908.1 hypothetical protein N7U66_18980 [Lacinutrix neustonica]
MHNILLLAIIVAFNISNAQVSDFKTIDFTKADNTAKINQGHSLENLPLLAYKLTHNLTTDVEKLRAIYTWVSTNIKGDSNQDEKVIRKRKKLQNDSIGYMKWNNQYKKITFKKLLKHKKTICTGYAYLMKELCFTAHIQCKIINGYGRTVASNIEALELANHSWNAIKLNNKWYLCDATWSSGYMVSGAFFVRDYNDGYFLTEPLLFGRNHYPLEKKWFLNDTLIQSEFIAAPLIYGETFKHKIIPIYPETLNTIIKKDDEISFRFKALNAVSEGNISLIQFYGVSAIPFKVYDLKNENGWISFKYRFKHKGFYDVHLKIGDDIVATYTIEVTKG